MKKTNQKSEQRKKDEAKKKMEKLYLKDPSIEEKKTGPLPATDKKPKE